MNANYNPENAEMTKAQSKLKPDTIYNCVVADIKDGITKDLLPEKAISKWTGKLEQPAIAVYTQIKYGDQLDEFIEFSKIFPYLVGEDGKTLYSEASNLAQYEKKYGNLPKVGDKIIIITDGEGKPSLKLK